MKLLVTGAAGFIGANLVRAWTGDGHDVSAVVRPTSDRWRLEATRCALYEVDLEVERTVIQLLDDVQPNVIVSAASHGAYAHQQDFDRMVGVNLRAVHHLVDWAVKHDVPLLHLGSSSEYGTLSNRPSEQSRIAPNSEYAISKAAGTHLICDAVARRGLRAVVLRLYSVYGPWEARSRLMPTLAAWALQRQLPPNLVDPSVARDFVYVDDVVDAATAWIHGLLVPCEPAIINVGSGIQYTLADVVEVVRKCCGLSDEPVWGTMANRAWDTTVWIADAERAKVDLGWSPRVSIADGFRALLDFVSDHPEHYHLG